MKKINHILSIICLLTTSSVASAANFTPLQTAEEIEQLLSFLVADSDKSAGAVYQGTAEALSGLILPLSYYNTPEYWGEYVCKLPGNNCQVTDLFYGDRDPQYTQTPDLSSPGGELQTERVNVNNGSDIYDGATWQIALSLAASHGVTHPAVDSLFTAARNETRLLSVGYDGNSDEAVNGANRAISNGEVFIYNGQRIKDPDAAYFYRMVTRNWVSVDPFKDTPYSDKYLSVKNIASNPGEYQPYPLGSVTWQDWKPITGENAWAFFEGPLQTDYLDHVASRQQQYIPFANASIQNALAILPTFSRMTSSLGGIYYGTKGALGNTGDQPINHYDVSVENIASSLSGLMLLHRALSDELAYQNNLSSNDKQRAQAGIEQIENIVYGGRLVDGRQTAGVLCFMKNYAWDDEVGYLLQGGLIDEPNKPRWQPTREPKAVDVTTWGITVLGQPLVDEWHGFGAAYQAWKNIKPWGGYCGGTESPCPANEPLWGVGYSNEDKNTMMSVEWTAGAINLLRALIVQYQVVVDDESDKYTDAEKAAANSFIEDMRRDERSMLENVQKLRIDHYAKGADFAAVRPANYDQLLHLDSADWQNKTAYLYANQRYMIPFGWYANPLPSTTSAAWMMMLYYNFNPFNWGGGYTPIQYDKNKLAQMTCQAEDNSGPLTTAVTINVLNQVKDAQLVGVNFVIDGKEQYGPQVQDEATVTVPAGTQALKTAYTIDGSNWYGACVIEQAKLLQDDDTLAVVWSNSQGDGPCEIR